MDEEEAKLINGQEAAKGRDDRIVILPLTITL